MRDVEKKAVHLVAGNHVEIGHAQILDDRIVYAQGTVQGEHDTYVVTIQPDGALCNCVFGMNRPGESHSHTIALELAVWNQERKCSYE